MRNRHSKKTDHIWGFSSRKQACLKRKKKSREFWVSSMSAFEGHSSLVQRYYTLQREKAELRGALTSHESPNPQWAVPSSRWEKKSSKFLSERHMQEPQIKDPNAGEQSQKIITPVPQLSMQDRNFLYKISESLAVGMYFTTNKTPRSAFSTFKTTYKNPGPWYLSFQSTFSRLLTMASLVFSDAILPTVDQTHHVWVRHKASAWAFALF